MSRSTEITGALIPLLLVACGAIPLFGVLQIQLGGGLFTNSQRLLQVFRIKVGSRPHICLRKELGMFKTRWDLFCLCRSQIASGFNNQDTLLVYGKWNIFNIIISI